MRDLTSQTEHQAGISARLDAYETDGREHDEPDTSAADHDCRMTPHPETCWGCAAFVRQMELDEQRQMAKVRAEKDAEHARNWWAS